MVGLVTCSPYLFSPLIFLVVRLSRYVPKARSRDSFALNVAGIGKMTVFDSLSKLLISQVHF